MLSMVFTDFRTIFNDLSLSLSLALSFTWRPNHSNRSRTALSADRLSASDTAGLHAGNRIPQDGAASNKGEISETSRTAAGFEGEGDAPEEKRGSSQSDNDVGVALNRQVGSGSIFSFRTKCHKHGENSEIGGFCLRLAT